MKICYEENMQLLKFIDDNLDGMQPKSQVQSEAQYLTCYKILNSSKIKSLLQNQYMTTDKKIDVRKLDHATLEVMRLRAIESTKAGIKATDLALAYGVHRRTVIRWLADYYKGGKQALKAKQIPGGPSSSTSPERVKVDVAYFMHPTAVLHER